jgi:hypothetical protein
MRAHSCNSRQKNLKFKVRGLSIETWELGIAQCGMLTYHAQGPKFHPHYCEKIMRLCLKKKKKEFTD